MTAFIRYPRINLIYLIKITDRSPKHQRCRKTNGSKILKASAGAIYRAPAVEPLYADRGTVIHRPCCRYAHQKRT